MRKTADNLVNKRATIYFENDLHHALCIKAAEIQTTISELVNVAVKQALSDDLEDLNAFAERSHEKDLPFEDVVRDLKKRGKL